MLPWPKKRQQLFNGKLSTRGEGQPISSTYLAGSEHALYGRRAIVNILNKLNIIYLEISRTSGPPNLANADRHRRRGT